MAKTENAATEKSPEIEAGDPHAARCQPFGRGGRRQSGRIAVGSRLVLMFPGFEPIPVEAHCRRFVREAVRAAPLYGMRIEASANVTEPQSQTRISTGNFTVAASGEGWATTTELVIYGLGEFNEKYAGRGPVRRGLGGLLALADFVATGTFFRYVSISWRYGLFFIFPLLVLVGAVLAAWAGYLLGAALLAATPTLAGWIAAIGAFLAVFVCAARRLHFLLVMDDWAFARDLARGAGADHDWRVVVLAADVQRRIDRSAAEEIVFAAHSFGAVVAVTMLAETLDMRATPGRYGLMTVGSSLLKIALHPAAKSLRAAVETIVRADAPWLDVQSRTDILNFYRSKPAELLTGRSGSAQTTTRVRFRHQLGEETYRAMKGDFFRVHRQFVFAVERRSRYSYHAILCGPEPFPEVARRGGLADDWSALAASPSFPKRSKIL
jgi:hypothetical protein